jgi:hypothetical protein
MVVSISIENHGRCRQRLRHKLFADVGTNVCPTLMTGGQGEVLLSAPFNSPCRFTGARWEKIFFDVLTFSCSESVKFYAGHLKTQFRGAACMARLGGGVGLLLFISQPQSGQVSRFSQAPQNWVFRRSQFSATDFAATFPMCALSFSFHGQL